MKNRLLIAWIILQLAVLGGWTALHEWQRQTGPRILLKLRPVDPYDLVRGRYQAIGFEIEQVPTTVLQTSSIQHPGEIAYGTPVWLVLQSTTNGWHTVQRVELKQPSEGLVARARYTYGWSEYDPEGKTNVPHGIQANLGVDRYFIPNSYENIPAGTNHVILGELSVGRSGNLQLERLLIDGKPY